VTTGSGDQTAAGAAAHGRFLASHTDREQVVDRLKAAFVEGRLTKDELDARAGQAFAARTYADLAALTDDIPARPAGARPRPEPTRVQARSPENKRAVTLRLAACAIIPPIVFAVAILTNNEAVARAIFPLAFVYLMASLIGVMHLIDSRLDRRRSRRSGGQPRDSRPGIAQLRLGIPQPPGAARLAHVFRHLEGVADRPPDGFGVYPVREGALNRASAEFVEYEVLGHALRIRLAELRVHPVPEFGQPHVAQGTAGPGPDLRGGKPVLAGGDQCPVDPETFVPMCRY